MAVQRFDRLVVMSHHTEERRAALVFSGKLRSRNGCSFSSLHHVHWNHEHAAIFGIAKMCIDAVDGAQALDRQHIPRRAIGDD